MLHYSFLVIALAATSIQGAPVTKRIAQSISAATTKWEQACIAAGGAQQCNPVSVAAFSTLLAAPGPCAQQDAADSMIDLAKTLGNDASMIALAQVFAQQPRNTPTSQSVQYCQDAPKNAELNGLFQCQFAGADPTVFVGGVAVGQPGTIPRGLNAPLSPAGSCPANPNGPIADGTQLVDLTQNPGVGNAPAGSGSDGNQEPPATPATTTVAPAKTSAATPPAGNNGADTTPPAMGGDLKLQNGKDAQALNAKFATLTADSPCTEGEQACVGSGFAQCVGGKFVVTNCGASLTCAALPLVNKAGTSIACTTEADAAARIAASGATGGVTGSGSNTPAAPASSSAAATTPTPNGLATGSAPASAGDFKLQNGKDAQKLNAKFATLTADSPCTDGEQACVGNGFAQCVGGKFVVSTCSASLTCAALPLVNKAGTSIACTTEADAAARIAASGATGGVTGA